MISLKMVGHTALLGLSYCAFTGHACADESDLPLGHAASETIWHFVLGAGIVAVPKYPGASVHKYEPLPLVGATYDRFFIGANPDAKTPMGLGVYLYRDNHWRVGAALSYDLIQPRRQSDDARLTGLGNIDRTAHAEFFTSYTLGWAEAKASVATDVAGKHEGTTASLDLVAHYQPISRLTLSAGPGVTWGSSQYNQTFFGVSSVQSIRSGLADYSTHSGVSLVRFSLNADYKLTKNWGLGALIAASRLNDRVGDSPIVEKKTQMTYGLFASYRF